MLSSTASGEGENSKGLILGLSVTGTSNWPHGRGMELVTPVYVCHRLIVVGNN